MYVCTNIPVIGSLIREKDVKSQKCEIANTILLSKTNDYVPSVNFPYPGHPCITITIWGDYRDYNTQKIHLPYLKLWHLRLKVDLFGNVLSFVWEMAHWNQSDIKTAKDKGSEKQLHLDRND